MQRPRPSFISAELRRQCQVLADARRFTATSHHSRQPPTATARLMEKKAKKKLAATK